MTTNAANNRPLIGRLLVGLTIGLLATSASAQNAVRGKALFNSTNGAPQSCVAASCHAGFPSVVRNSVNKGTSATVILNAISTDKGGMRALMPFVNATDATDIAAYIANPAAANGTPAITPSATTLTFGSTQIAVTNSTSTPASITLTNTGAAPLTITGLAKSGANATEFTVTGTCAGTSVTVNAGASCTIGATFTPLVAGTRSATLTVQSNATTNPTITLTGTAAAAATPSIVINPASLLFNSQTVGTPSAVRQIAVTNNGTLNISITQVASSANTEFAMTTDCVGNLAAGATCSVNITLTPSVAGARSATLTITSNATGSPHRIALSGPGVTVPTGAATLAASALSFPATPAGTTATAMKTTLTNTGNAPLSVASVALGGANSAEFGVGGNTTCGTVGMLAVDSSCDLEATFTPQSSGGKSASIVVTHGVGTSTVALDGTGMAAVATNAGGTSPTPATTTPAAPVASSALAPSNVGGGGGAIDPGFGLLLLVSAAALRRRSGRGT